MVSLTQQTERIRHRKVSRQGRGNRQKWACLTPSFAVHQEGYDPNAADAKKAPEAKSE